ncbi:MAG: alpha/beta fold hydrolase [Parvibaculales bacterium]
MSQEKSINWDAAAELVEIKGNPVPARGQAGYIRARDGKLLRNAVFSPDAPAKGTIVLMTGYSEFIEKYFETIADLTARGYCVAALEWRGHGLSEGNSKEPTRLHLSDFDQNIEDMEDRFDRLVRGHCPPPYFGLAHSMGGQISLRMVQRHADWLSALAQSAPMLGVALPPLLNFIRAVVMPPLIAVKGGDNWNSMDPPSRTPENPPRNNVTSDAARYERCEELCLTDERLQVNGRSLGWSRTAFAKMAASQKPAFLRSIKTPVFIGTAEHEKLVDNGAHELALSHLPHGEGRFYRNAMHEIMMETDAIRQAFLDDVLAFFERHRPD